MNSNVLSTLIPVLILIAIVVMLIRKLLLMLRHGRNQVRDAMGKNSAELDKAIKIMTSYQKNGLIPKWATEDAINTLKKYYTAEASVDAVIKMMQSSGMKRVDLPKSYYLEPGTAKEKLSEACNARFKNFDMQAMLKENGTMTEKDFKVFTNLTYMWYFADDSVSTQDEAMTQVREVYGAFCEKYGELHGLREKQG